MSCKTFIRKNFLHSETIQLKFIDIFRDVLTLNSRINSILPRINFPLISRLRIHRHGIVVSQMFIIWAAASTPDIYIFQLPHQSGARFISSRIFLRQKFGRANPLGELPNNDSWAVSSRALRTTWNDNVSFARESIAKRKTLALSQICSCSR